MRHCKQCEVDKSLEDFPIYKHPNGTTYYRWVCRECFNAKVRQQPSQTKQAKKDGNIRYKYGLSAEQYSELIKNGCEVCGTSEKLCIDHDHNCCPGTKTCGECVRGVLCDKHNRAEGMLTADEAVALAAYMLRNEEVKVK